MMTTEPLEKSFMDRGLTSITQLNDETCTASKNFDTGRTSLEENQVIKAIYMHKMYQASPKIQERNLITTLEKMEFPKKPEELNDPFAI